MCPAVAVAPPENDDAEVGDEDKDVDGGEFLLLLLLLLLPPIIPPLILAIPTSCLGDNEGGGEPAVKKEEGGKDIDSTAGKCKAKGKFREMEEEHKFDSSLWGKKKRIRTEMNALGPSYLSTVATTFLKKKKTAARIQ